MEVYVVKVGLSQIRGQGGLALMSRGRGWLCWLSVHHWVPNTMPGKCNKTPMVETISSSTPAHCRKV